MIRRRLIFLLLALLAPLAILAGGLRAAGSGDFAAPTALSTGTGPAASRILVSLEAASGTLAPAQADVLAGLPPIDFQLLHRYQAVPALAGLATAEGMAILRAHRLVTAVTLDQPGQGHLGESVPALGADVVHASYGLTGAGVAVAVLDTGVDTDHPDLAAAVVAQHCFTAGDCPPGNSNEGPSAEDEHGHGTNVAGIVAGRGAVASPGFAPGADLVAVRVLAGDNTGWVSDWVAGLDWVLVNGGAHNVRVVNMSLGTFTLYGGNCDSWQPQLAAAIGQLNAAGVTVFVSSGNEGSATQMTAPACNSGVVAVGATYDGDLGREPDGGTYQDWFGGSWPPCFDGPTGLQTVACFTNSNGRLDILAPGSRLTAAGLGGGVSTYIGTSQAAPSAAGVAALLLEADSDLDPATLESLLEASGPSLIDPKNGLAFPAINALNAVAALPVAPAAVTVVGPAAGDLFVVYPFTATVSPLTATQPITYLWQTAGRPSVIHVGGSSDTAVLSFTVPGPQTVTMTAANVAGSVVAGHAIILSAVAPLSLAVSGPAGGLVGAPLSFGAMAGPPSATLPLTYTWQTDGRPPLVRSGGLSDTAVLSWDAPGSHTVTVTTANPAGSVSADHSVTLTALPLAGVALSGPMTGTLGAPVPVTAVVTPTAVSLPITYTWQATGHAPFSRAGGLSDTAVFAWPITGTQTVTVTAAHPTGSFSAARSVAIVAGWRVYLPVVIRP